MFIEYVIVELEERFKEELEKLNPALKDLVSRALQMIHSKVEDGSDFEFIINDNEIRLEVNKGEIIIRSGIAMWYKNIWYSQNGHLRRGFVKKAYYNEEEFGVLKEIIREFVESLLEPPPLRS